MFFHKILSLIAVLCSAVSVTVAQSDFPKKHTLGEMGVVIVEDNLPKNYEYNTKGSLMVYPTTTKADGRIIVGHPLYGKIASKDSNFLLMIEVIPLNVIMDSTNSKIWLESNEKERLEDGYGIGRWRTWKPNDYHINNLLFLLSVQQKTFNFDKDTLVHYYTHTESREMFNADTVIRVDIDLPRFYDGKQTFQYESRHYNHMQVYFIHRHNHGFFTLFCFTNDEGQRDFAKHFKALQQIFRYKDDEQTN